jgi:hypothetical protein
VVSIDEIQALIGNGARLNVDIFRIRKQLLAIGAEDGAAIIERRPSDRAIRIGTGRLRVISC